MATKVYKVTLLVVDHDNIGPDGVREEIENAHYGNRCIAPRVMVTEEKTVEWSDGHPLNMRASMDTAFAELFGDG